MFYFLLILQVVVCLGAVLLVFEAKVRKLPPRGATTSKWVETTGKQWFPDEATNCTQCESLGSWETGAKSYRNSRRKDDPPPTMDPQKDHERN